MAVVRFGPLVQSVRGSLGSVVFARQGGSAIVRPRPLKVNQGTVRQLETRSGYGRVVAKWRSLTDEERLAWFRCAQTYRHVAPEGVSRPLTAWQVFAMVNLRVVDMGYELTELPDPINGMVETSFVRLDVWPGGPVRLVNSCPDPYRGTCYGLYVQRPFRTWPTLAGRLRRRAWHDLVMNHSETITTGFGAVAGAPGIGEYVDWDCISHILWWPSSTRWSGKLIVPNVGPELMTSGDMELGLYPNPPTGWHLFAAGSLVRWGTLVWGDNGCARWLRAASGGVSGVYTDFVIDLSTAGTYNLRFAAKCVRGTPWDLAYVATSLVVVAYIVTPALPEDGLWHEYVCPFTVVTGAAACKLQFANSNATDMAVYLDDVSIRRDL